MVVTGSTIGVGNVMTDLADTADSTPIFAALLAERDITWPGLTPVGEAAADRHPTETLEPVQLAS